MASRSKKVLITGIDGFTGIHLEGLLAVAGYDVVGLVYPKSSKKNHLICDIARKIEVVSALKSVKPDYVIHLAGISFVPYADVKLLYDINFFGTLNILDGLLEVEPAPVKVILASSANVYGNSAAEIIDETVCPAPTNHYANSKLAMEFMARNYFDRLNILITRPFNYTGVGQSAQFLIPKIVAHFKANKQEIELGNLDVVRDISDVRFVAETYKHLMECDCVSEVVNICSGRGVSLTDILDRMSTLTRRLITVKVNPEFIRKNEVKTLIGSNTKLFSLTGQQKQYPIEETLRWMLDTK